jgi:hypothetical protein
MNVKRRMLQCSNFALCQVFWVRGEGGDRIVLRSNRYVLALAMAPAALESSGTALHKNATTAVCAGE